MMSSLDKIIRQVLGLMVVAAMFCGLTTSHAQKEEADHEHHPSHGVHFESGYTHVHAHTHDHAGDHCGDEDHHAPCDDGHDEDCPDTPHHHHKGAGCCQILSFHAARMVATLTLHAPTAGRASVEWKNQRCDLDAVRELDLPPII